MASIDLKKCTIKFKDGTALVGAVNLMAGYPIGTTTMLVDQFVAEDVKIYSRFTVVGDAIPHIITARVFGVDTTSLTFTPALAAAVLDNAIITVGPNELEVTIGEGEVSWDETQERIYQKNRGRLGSVRDGDETPVDVTMAYTFESLTAGTADTVPTVRDVLYQEGPAANWVSSDTDDPCAPYSVDIEIVNDPECVSFEPEQITLSAFRFEKQSFKIKDASVDVTGKCNITKAAVERI